MRMNEKGQRQRERQGKTNLYLRINDAVGGDVGLAASIHKDFGVIRTHRETRKETRKETKTNRQRHRDIDKER